MRPRFGTAAAICLLLASAFSQADEMPVDIFSKAALVYKADPVTASAQPAESGQGIRLNYDFTKGGNSVRFEFAVDPPLDGPFAKLLITAKGPEIPVVLIVRGDDRKGVAYQFGPLSAEEQVFTVDLAKPVFTGGQEARLQYPIRGLSFTIRGKDHPSGTVEISKVAGEN